MSKAEKAKDDDGATKAEAKEASKGDGTEENASEPVKKSLKDKILAQKKYILIGLSVIAVIGSGAGVYLSGFFTIHKPHETTLQLPGEVVYHEMPRFTVNLKPTEQRKRPFIRLTMQAELQGESAKAAFIEHEMKIMDAIQSHLRTITFEELNGQQGTERLRQDMIIIINRIIKPEIAVTVLYKDIFMR